jgi:hypothetical protein
MYHEEACLTLYFKGHLALLIRCIYILKHESKTKSQIRYILLFFLTFFIWKEIHKYAKNSPGNK